MASEYTIGDFLECVNVLRQEVTRLATRHGDGGRVVEVLRAEDVTRVTAAWGMNGDYSEWEGGFVGQVQDGRWFYLSGWCDTTGWG